MTDEAIMTTPDLDRFFREVVLCLAGILAMQECDDDLVRQVMRSLDRIYLRNRARLLEDEGDGDSDASLRRIELHPAALDLLSRIGR